MRLNEMFFNIKRRIYDEVQDTKKNELRFDPDGSSISFGNPKNSQVTVFIEKNKCWAIAEGSNGIYQKAVISDNFFKSSIPNNDSDINGYVLNVWNTLMSVVNQYIRENSISTRDGAPDIVVSMTGKENEIRFRGAV